MKARKINLENYPIQGFDEKGKEKEVPYDVRGSLVTVLFNKDLNLSAVELLDRDDLARRIRDCKGKEILLEEADYQKIRQSLEVIRGGLGQTDVGFVRRVLECPQIEVEEKKVKR